ncbi:MAG: LPS export ABC transporter periplasmic protein LptC [Spirochaetaceae bacterium]|nr:LPS export ABC transporter periplasmic protein LptC [Spirochaetaceae bacterium]
MKRRRPGRRPVIHAVLLSLPMLWAAACSFDYGAGSETDADQPDIVMDNVEYVRVRDGDPVVRFEAERVERYESRQTMELRQFSFEQFESHGLDINAVGNAGRASVETDSGNISMEGGVRIAVESEDITIETETLTWQDKERFLMGGDYNPVDIKRSDGTSFTGQGFSADARRRTWSFTYGVDGIYIHEDEDEEPDTAEGEGAETGDRTETEGKTGVEDKTETEGKTDAGDKTKTEGRTDAVSAEGPGPAAEDGK